MDRVGLESNQQGQALAQEQASSSCPTIFHGVLPAGLSATARCETRTRPTANPNTTTKPLRPTIQDLHAAIGFEEPAEDADPIAPRDLRVKIPPGPGGAFRGQGCLLPFFQKVEQWLRQPGIGLTIPAR